MSILTINDILNFWKCFLQEKINLWDYNNKLVGVYFLILF